MQYCCNYSEPLPTSPTRPCEHFQVYFTFPSSRFLLLNSHLSLLPSLFCFHSLFEFLTPNLQHLNKQQDTPLFDSSSLSCSFQHKVITNQNLYNALICEGTGIVFSMSILHARPTLAYLTKFNI